ncbi:MAG: hypothetical protein KGI27_14320 [Thaumarchaeota archaeon]|nr:hypothetical protein [Nitrososphaerota archaeon]
MKQKSVFRATESYIVEQSLKIRTFAEAKEIIGGDHAVGFSDVTKMPCKTYSLPATMCRMGTKLRSVEGSVCSDCYACPSENASKHNSGWYGRDRVQQPMNHRLLQVWFNPRWADAMIFLFQHYKFKIFRWHDSGDIQNKKHFEDICRIADAAPMTKFWLPTQEWGAGSIIENYWVEHGMIPLKELHPNLIIRLSARMKNGEAPVWYAKRLGVTTSRVSTKNEDVSCIAAKQGNNCGACRKCWDQEEMEIIYHYHGGNNHFMQSTFMKRVQKSIIFMTEQGVDKTTMYKQVSEKFHISNIAVRVATAKLKKKMNNLKVLE